jgi:hypothetical protein
MGDLASEPWPVIAGLVLGLIGASPVFIKLGRSLGGWVGRAFDRNSDVTIAAMHDPLVLTACGLRYVVLLLVVGYLWLPVAEIGVPLLRQSARLVLATVAGGVVGGAFTQAHLVIRERVPRREGPPPKGRLQ